MGLRTHMIRVYNYMAGGVALTGVVAWLTYQMAVVTDAGGRIIGLTFGQTLFGSPLKWLIILAPLGFVLLFSFRIGQLQASTARVLFFAFAGIFGLSLATITAAITFAVPAKVQHCGPPPPC
jgi:FtsH-binding integral membrane protein